MATDGVHVEEIASAFDGIVDPVIAVLLVDLVILQGHLVPGLGGFVAGRRQEGLLQRRQKLEYGERWFSQWLISQGVDRFLE